MTTDGIFEPGDVRVEALLDGGSLGISTHRDVYYVDRHAGTTTPDELYAGTWAQCGGTHVPDPDYAHRWRLYSDVLASGRENRLAALLLARWKDGFAAHGHFRIVHPFSAPDENS